MPSKQSFTLIEDVGTYTHPCHSDTEKPVGVRFRMPGHGQIDMVVLLIERVSSKCRFVLEACERYWNQK
jgi:hypothetical protein